MISASSRRPQRVARKPIKTNGDRCLKSLDQAK